MPIVFYTGTRRWDTVGRLVDLVELGDRFEAVTPTVEPVFLNLDTLSPQHLENAGGFFGWVLRLVQERKARPDEFKALLERVIEELETMPERERLRWLELLSYVHALVYHERDEPERPALQQTIEDSVRTDKFRQEMTMARRTIAEALKAEGRREGRRQEAVRSRQQTLLRMLQNHFGDLPQETVDAINQTTKVRQLDAWLDRILTARHLDDMGIGPSE